MHCMERTVNVVSLQRIMGMNTPFTFRATDHQRTPACLHFVLFTPSQDPYQRCSPWIVKGKYDNCQLQMLTALSSA